VRNKTLSSTGELLISCALKGAVAEVVALTALSIDESRSLSCAAAEVVFREDLPSTTTKYCITKELVHDCVWIEYGRLIATDVPEIREY
jgi:hypothetical protein